MSRTCNDRHSGVKHAVAREVSRMDIQAIRQRPAAATYWEGCLWEYPREARSKSAGILDVFSPILVPPLGEQVKSITYIYFMRIYYAMLA